MQPHVSIIIATRNRAPLLAGMLRSLDRVLSGVPVQAEVIVADNGSTDDTAAVLTPWVRAAPGRRCLTVPEPGKAHALNHAVLDARGSLLVFTDDDVHLRPDWLGEILKFFDLHPTYAAAVGRVSLPPEVTDPELRRRVALYRTIPLFDKGDAVRDDTHLYGCNMMVRRSTFERVGLFNERLGPGASGLHEDGDLARRVVRAGLRIGYLPTAVVYHVVEPERLTFDYFRTLHLRDARSRFAMNEQDRWTRSALHLAGATAVFCAWSLLFHPRQRMRARGRMIRYAELLRLQWNHPS